MLVSTAFTRERMEKEVPGALEQMAQAGPQNQKPYKDAIAQGKKIDGSPLDDATRRKATRNRSPISTSAAPRFAGSSP